MAFDLDIHFGLTGPLCGLAKEHLTLSPSWQIVNCRKCVIARITELEAALERESAVHKAWLARFGEAVPAGGADERSTQTALTSKFRNALRKIADGMHDAQRVAKEALGFTVDASEDPSAADSAGNATCGACLQHEERIKDLESSLQHEIDKNKPWTK